MVGNTSSTCLQAWNGGMMAKARREERLFYGRNIGAESLNGIGEENRE
jgi:hypothetical protein